MSTDIKHPWILAGYELFARQGPKGLKVEVIARKVNKSKSSFYHHFADLEVFTEVLLEYHLLQSRALAARERACKRIEPDLIEILLDAKQDLLFNRQLRINRANEVFQQYLHRTDEEVSGAFMDVWASELGIPGKLHLAQDMYDLALENFYLQLTDETLTYDWLAAYFQQLRNMVQAFKRL